MVVQKAKSGFTLLEVMVAFALFMLGMTSVVMMSLQAARMGQSARNRVEALHQARAQMEELMRMNYFDPFLVPGTKPVTMGKHSGSVEVSDRSGGTSKNLVVEMEYRSFRNVATVELEGVISRALH